jgi:hypothetical protein
LSPPPDVDGDTISPEIQKRFAETRRELETSTQSTVTGAKEAGRALALAGDLWRRRELLGDTTRDVVLAVDKIEAQAAQAFVAGVDVDAEHKKLIRALDDAFEAVLEDGEDRALYTHSAEMALAARDALASARAALAFALDNDGTESTRIATLRSAKTELDDKLAKIDRGLVKKARCLVGINQVRRRETAALDRDERSAAWWWSARANCDFLVSLYRSEEGAPGAQTRLDVTSKHNAAHLATCEDCQRDVEASSLAYTPQHVTASSLWRRQHGEATQAEVAFMDTHAKSCKDCQRALDALAQPEE